MRVTLLVLALFGCQPNTDDTDTGDSGAVTADGLPTGASTWSGTAEVSGFPFLFSLELTNSGGDLTGYATVEDDPEQPVGIGRGVYSVSGTHEPVSGRVALAPEDWTERPTVDIELVGFSGTWDGVSTMTGTVADYASGADNTLAGGPATLTLQTGDGAPLGPGDGARALPVQTRPFSGTMQCTGPQRELAGELTWDGVGDVSGTITFGEPTMADGADTFAFTGVHNPSTGGLTLVPGLYEDTDHTFAAFFVEATYDPGLDAFLGELRQNVGACPPDLWQASF